MGVDLTRQYYAATHFVAESLSLYAVRADFPAIRASVLSAAIDKVRYDVAVSSIGSFLVTHQKL